MRWNPNEEEDEPYKYPEMLESYEKSLYNWQPEMTDKILRISKS